MTEPTPSTDAGSSTTAGQAELPDEKTRLTTLTLQLVVIPLAVVLFCVALGGLFMWMTSERKDMDDYLRSLRGSSGAKRSQQAQYLLNYVQESKRWQGIFDMTAQMSGDREEFLKRNPRAVTDVVAVFNEAGDDAKTRRYLALVLGLLGDPQAMPALRSGLNDTDPDTVKNCLWALTRLGDQESAGKAIELSGNSDPSVRMMAVYALGFLQHPQARGVLIGSLKDGDELVKWNAAFALAYRGDPEARETLVRLLDKEYVDRFTQVTDQNRQRYRVKAVEWLAKLDAAGAPALLEKVSKSDADMQVRNAAMQTLNELQKK